MINSFYLQWMSGHFQYLNINANFDEGGFSVIVDTLYISDLDLEIWKKKH